jgi:hypothetical protein
MEHRQTETARLRDIANSLDCLTEQDLNLLSGTQPSTTDAWRRRGKGPEYILFGNAILYPREPLKRHLATLIRERKNRPVKELL